MEAADVSAVASAAAASQIRFRGSSAFIGGSEVGGQEIRFTSWELDTESRC